jgi:hypothetical protein
LQAVELPDIIGLNQFSTWLSPPSPALNTTFFEEKIMKLVKNFALAVLLAFVLAVSAPAGEIGMPGVANPTPTPTPSSASSTADGKSDAYDDPNVTLISAETSDYLFYEALEALLSLY